MIVKDVFIGGGLIVLLTTSVTVSLYGAERTVMKVDKEELQRIKEEQKKCKALAFDAKKHDECMSELAKRVGIPLF